MTKITSLLDMATALNDYTQTSKYKGWEKGGKKRIYIQGAGYNTKKMKTNVFIDLSGDTASVNVTIDCPSQHSSWIASQEAEIVAVYEEQVQYCNEHFDFSKNMQPVDIVMNSALLAAEEVKGCYTEWREVRVKINRFGKLAVRNRQFVIPLSTTKDKAPKTFLELTDTGYEFLKARGEDMLDPYQEIPDYHAAAERQAQYIAEMEQRKAEANATREEKVKALHDVDEKGLETMAKLIAVGISMREAWKLAGCPHPAPAEIVQAKRASGLSWPEFAASIVIVEEGTIDDNCPF